MSDSVLRFSRLVIRRTQGIKDPFVIADLGAGINVIHGPNASGKTTTAAALHALLWPKAASSEFNVEGSYAVGGASYLVELVGGSLAVQKDGAESNPLELPAPHLSQRYQLSLHDLLLASERNDDFAAEIERQSRGGCDFDKAAKLLGYREKHSASRDLADEIESARLALRQRQAEQESLHREAARIAELERRIADAEGAALKASAIDKELERRRAVDAVSEAEGRLAGFPTALGRMSGNEAEAIEKLQLEGARLASEHAAAEEAERMAEEAARTALPKGRIPEHVIQHATTSLDALKDREEALRQAARDEARARATEVEAARQLGTEVSPERLAALDVGAFAGLAAFARKADRFRGEEEACEAEVRQAAAIPETGPIAPERLQAGIRVLQQWLREPEAGSRAASPWALWTAAFAGVAGWILLALNSGFLAAVGAVAVLVLTLVGLRAPRPGASLREMRRADYGKLGLPEPAKWAEAEVAARLEDLLAQLAAAELGKRRAQWLEHARGRLARLDPERTELEAERQALVDRLGVAPDTDSVRLVVIAEQAGRLFEARQVVAGAVAAREEAERQLNVAAREVDTAFANGGFAAPTGYAAAQAELNTILELSRRHETAVNEATAARLARETAQNRLVVVHGELKELYARCECDFGDAQTVNSHCGQYADFQSAARQIDVLRHELERATAALRAIEAEHQYVASLGSLATAELEAERALAKDKVAERDLLRDERTTLQTRIATAKDASDVGSALARLAAAEGALRAARAKDRRAMVGHALLQCVRRASHNEHRPPVFRSASDKFARITCGRYTLDLPAGSTGGSAAFRALDAHTGRGYALNELSSATRIQLLLAVRVAFVESQEAGLKLPLFLDETLATSDDHRAAAIIEAVIAIAEEGRQVFYFTAQHDEVAKWNAALAGRAVSYKEHDLRKLRSVFTKDLEPSPFAGLMAQIEQPLPEVGSHTYETYGAVLGVPPITPGRTPLSATHLWYLTEDPGELRKVLGTGLTTWGELQNLIAANAVKLLADHPQVIARGTALAKALEVMHAQAAIGLGKPVGREVLEASGAVSAKMMPHVLKLAGECSGQALKLVEALTAGRVPGFQAKKIAELREYLEEYEYVDPRVPLSAAEIRILMLAAVQHEVEAGILAAGDIDALIRRVVRGPTPPESDLSIEALPPTGDAPEVS